MLPDLDDWLPDARLRVCHRRESSVAPAALWRAAQQVRLCDARVLGRLVRSRIPGLPADAPFDELFRQPPFIVLCSEGNALVSGLVGRIWTIRRDYPLLSGAEEFRSWSAPGTVRVLLANWVEPVARARSASRSAPRSALISEARVSAVDAKGRVGLAAVRPLVAASQHLVASDGIAAAVARAERQGRSSGP